METAVVEKKEAPTGENMEGANTGATGAPENVSGEDKEGAQGQQEQTPPVQVAPLKINEEKLKASGNKSTPAFAHVTLMEANGIKPESLPKELKMKINAWSMGLRKYNKQATPKLLEMVKKGSVEIADLIQDWREKDLPEKTEEQILAEKKAKEEKERKENEAKALEKANQEKAHREKAQREEAERKQKEALALKERELKAKREAQEKAESAKKSIEQKVQAILNERGKIRYKELVEILGHDVGESVQVGSIKLLNVYFTNSYKQVK